MAQELGGAGLLSALVWSRRSTGLVVYSDEPGSPGLPSNDGWGRSWGLQGRLVLSRGRVRFETSYALGFAHRTNPRAVVLPATSASTGDPRHSLRAGAEVSIGRRRNITVSGDYTWQSGWAIATLLPVDEGQGLWSWAPTDLDDRRTDGLHRIALQWEHRMPFERWRLVGTVALAAVPLGTGPVQDCPPTAGEGEDSPQCRSLDFLPPVMPWLGLRAEW